MLKDLTDKQYYKLWKMMEDKVATYEETGKGMTRYQYYEMKLLLKKRKERLL